MAKRLFFLFCAALLFLSGPAVSAEETGVTEDQIVIGSSLALSGHAGYLGMQYKYGALAYLHYVNDHGGINGRRIKVLWEDDGYDPQRTIVNTKKLIEEDRVFCLFDYVGSATTVKVLPILENQKIPLVGVLSGTQFLREPFKRYVFNIRSSYYKEIDTVMAHAVKDLGLKKIAVFYQYDTYGMDGLKGAETALKTYGLSPVAAENYERGTLDIENALEKIRASGAEMVVMAGIYGPCAKFILEGKKRGFRPIYYNLSFVGPEKLMEMLGAEGQGEILTLVTPPIPRTPSGQAAVKEESSAPGGAGQAKTATVRLNDMKGIAEYEDILKQYFPVTPSSVSFEGFLNAKVLVEGLKRCGTDLTREKFIHALESIRDLDLGVGVPLSFSASDHQGLKEVYLVKIDGGEMIPLSNRRELKK
jgi:ABC-type branched-subunit amino acid transport system substrate-binding protein